MNEQDKQPLTEEQLSVLLRKWDVSAPARLEDRVFATRRQPPGSRMKWWRFLLRGSIPVPVPVACCLLLVVALVLWRSTKPDVTCVAAAAPAVTAAPAVASMLTCPVDAGC